VTHPLLADERAPLESGVAFAECAALARRQARNFYYAFLPLRRRRRHALYSVYAFARLADDLADEPGPGLSERLEQLDRLQRRLQQSLEGRPRGAVFAALAESVGRFQIPTETLFELLEGVRQDQHRQRYRNWAQLERYCYLVAGTVGRICAAVFEARGPEADRYAIAQGLGMQLVNIMRDVTEDAAAGRLYLPEELLEQHGLSVAQVMAGRPDPQRWRAVMSEVGARAREALREGAGLLPLAAPDARICPALLRELYEAILDRLEAGGWEPGADRVELSTPCKAGLMLSAWWRYRVLGR
jgi:15-cis-phytoene synthase